MATIQAQLAELESTPDPIRRMELAFSLADAGADGLPELLVRLIARPELASQRASFVHCLGQFDCSPYFGLLIEMILKGNAETAHIAFEIIGEIEHLSGADVEAAFQQIEKARQRTDHPDWRRDFLDALWEMFE
ncbi:hypothetical protein ACFSM5_04400 [Lacibacterium aquatile]|uniref:HEAT repeat domain-containing protein n=1 Tax=Lacibacterium aquatile TaxID=1168082 RepID=A0ABW5DRF6_9PROT